METAAATATAAAPSRHHFPFLGPAPPQSSRGAVLSPPPHPPPEKPYPAHANNYDDDDDDDDINDDWREAYANGLKLHVEPPPAHDPRDDGTADAWIERHESLVRLTGRHPFNAEPPLTKLMQHGFITPVPIHYVRNHGAVPRASRASWTVEVNGLVRRPAKISMPELVHGFEHFEIPVTLVCAGNRRKEQNAVKQTKGFNWGPAAIGTSVWRGVRLRDVLRRCGVLPRSAGAAFVCFEGAEDLPGGGGSKYGTSLRREVAMDPSRDVMLAYLQNGEPLTPDHGFPVRVIIPGHIGGRMIKWLRRIVVTPAESDNYYHYHDNRVLPAHVDAELADAESWWYKPENIINELNINSVITTPGHEDIVPINPFTTQRPCTMKGYAYSGGGRMVTRVEVTLDGGESWLVCSLEHPEKPTKYGKYWCWCFWSIDVELLDLLAAKSVAVRAWDESHNTQPEKMNWNIMGMMNNCWYKVKVSVCRPNHGEVGLVFEHPTQPGNQPGGWMARHKHLDGAEAPAGPVLKKSTSSPFMSAPSRKFSMSEVRKHSSRESAWIVVHGSVYDCTTFLKDHPGGADSILINAGSDCTEEFDAIHSDKAKIMLNPYRIGEIIVTGYSSDVSVHGGILSAINEVANGSAPATAALLNPREKVHCRLVERKEISRDVRLLRFSLPSSDQPLGLPVGKHVFVSAVINGKLCVRAYTPTSAADVVGYFDLLIRVYFKGENPKFPDGGLMSQYLNSLSPGASINIKGPVGHIEYTGGGNFIVDGKPRFARRLAMVAGGTGITPVYQVMQAVMRGQPEDLTELHLVYANRTEDDILLRDELDQWAAANPGRVHVWYVVSQLRQPSEWKYSIGLINGGILREHLPEGSGGDALALVCGPPGMVQSAVLPHLEGMKYDAESRLVF